MSEILVSRDSGVRDSGVRDSGVREILVSGIGNSVFLYPLDGMESIKRTGNVDLGMLLRNCVNNK